MLDLCKNFFTQDLSNLFIYNSNFRWREISLVRPNTLYGILSLELYIMILNGIQINGSLVSDSHMGTWCFTCPALKKSTRLRRSIQNRFSYLFFYCCLS